MITIKNSPWWTISGSLYRIYNHPRISWEPYPNNICQLIKDVIMWSIVVTFIYAVLIFFFVFAPIIIGIMWYELGLFNAFAFGIRYLHADPFVAVGLAWIVMAIIAAGIYCIIKFDDARNAVFDVLTKNLEDTTTWEILVGLWRRVKDKTCVLVEFKHDS